MKLFVLYFHFSILTQEEHSLYGSDTRVLWFMLIINYLLLIIGKTEKEVENFKKCNTHDGFLTLKKIIFKVKSSFRRNNHSSNTRGPFSVAVKMQSSKSF